MQVKTIDEMCKNAFCMVNSRKIVIWGSNHFALSLKRKLDVDFGLKVYCLVDNEIELNSLDIREIEMLSNNCDQYFLLVTKIISEERLELIKKFGYSSKDYIYMDLGLDKYFLGKTGLEIGGPSQFYYSIYNVVKQCDGVNFSDNTVWGHTDISKGYFYQSKKMGDFYNTDAVDLFGINTYFYDFVLSSNNLEHIANPIKAVLKWKEVIKEGGNILIIVPNKEYSFDHKREYTTYKHILNDYKSNVNEKDLTHLDEILQKHDLDIDIRAGGFENFKNRSLQNYNNRCLHHHVFNEETLIQIFKYCGIHTVEHGKYRECYYLLGKIC